jgi:hypothetical protein
MKDRIAPDIPLAIVLFAAVAAVAAVALRAAARRPAPRPVPGTEPAPVTVTADESRPWPAVTTGTQDGAGDEMARPPGPPDRPATAVEQMQHVFHELHADGRNALCAVCDSQYGSA